MTQTTKIVLVDGERRLELEGEPTFVEKHLKALLPIITRQTDEGGQGAHGGKSEGGGDGQRQSIQTFMESKNPTNLYEGIACVLYYNYKQTAAVELSVQEIRNGLIQGKKVRPVDNMNQALSDCRRKYGYVEAGSQKGSWKLSHSGETMVEFDLPRKKG